jgi:hypothetical protein
VSGFWERIGRAGRAAALVAVGLAGGAAALAVASVPGSDGVIHGCYGITVASGTTKPAATAPLRIIDPSASQSCATTTSLGGGPPSEAALDWNAAGPQGPTGPAGVPGQTGGPGQPGAQGPAVTIAAGHTFTIAGGQVITVGNSPGLTIAPPAINNAHPVGIVVIGSGRSALTFDISGLGFANQTATSGSGGGAGKVSLHDISITKKVDKSSPSLFRYCANGKHLPQVSIQMRKAGKTYLKYILSSVLVSSYQTGGSGHAGQPTESLSLNFTKIEIRYSK